MANASLHNAWAAGHFILLLSAARYAFAWCTLRWTGYDFWYKATFAGALISYAIVCYKSLGPPQPNKAYLQRVMVDENAQYFLLAAFWLYTKPVAFAIVPYATFSLFHALTFTRTNILPKAFPSNAAPTVGPNGQSQLPQTPLQKKIHVWVKSYYEPAMSWVARFELIILLRVLIGAVLFRNSIAAPLFYAQFLRTRYLYSPFTQDAIAYADTWLTTQVQNPSIPPQAKKGWEVVRMLIVRCCEFSVITPQRAPAAPGPARQ